MKIELTQEEKIERRKRLAREKRKRWRAKNPEKAAASDRAQYERRRQDAEFMRRGRERAKQSALARPEEVRAYHRKWYRENIEKRKARARRQRAEMGKEALRLYFQQHYKKNRDRKRAIAKSYRENNQDKCRLWGRIKAQRKRSAGKLSAGIVHILLSEQGGKCPYCAADLLETKFHIDHYMPIILGGRNEDHNIQLTCPTCNNRKHKSHPLEFADVVFREQFNLVPPPRETL